MTTNHCYYIGLVRETKGKDLTDKDKVLFGGQFRSLNAVEREGVRVRLSFNFLRKKDSWDLELTNRDIVYTLGVNRITGMKGLEND